MADDVKTKNVEPSAGSGPTVGNKAPILRGRQTKRGRDPRASSRAGRGRRGGAREERVRPEFDQRILAIRRVARVSAGGRRFNFSAAIVIGNGRGTVGVGTGKGADTALALDKAMRDAKKHLLRVPVTGNASIPHMVSAKYSSARVIIFPARGRGLIAGSAVRDLLALGGITDVNAKIFSGSKNKLNIARATIVALKSFAQKPQSLSTKSPAYAAVASAGRQIHSNDQVQKS